ncbi:conserved hypothetical protein [Oceanicaulis sp. 350]|nr:conserved hypothetical protein [Oceanicaulis sp. 350]
MPVMPDSMIYCAQHKIIISKNVSYLKHIRRMLRCTLWLRLCCLRNAWLVLRRSLHDKMIKACIS